MVAMHTAEVRLRPIFQAWNLMVFSGLAAAFLAPVHGQVAINMSGLVTDSAGTPIPAASVRLENGGQTATTGADGRFTLNAGTSIRGAGPRLEAASIREGSLYLSVPARSSLEITVTGMRGEELAFLRREVEAGSHALRLPDLGSGVRFIRISDGGGETRIRAFSLAGALRAAGLGKAPLAPASPAAKRSGLGDFFDVLSVTKAGYQKAYLSVSRPDSTNIRIRMLREGAARFSFFVTSLKAIVQLSGDTAGFGGDLRFGETGAGAGLRGADKICATLAERSMPGSSVKGWRAFLSVTADAHGRPANAIERIGSGPWYDRLGRLLAPTLNDLKNVRPQNGDLAIRNDLPNEDGVPNHRPDPNLPQVDNHHFLTGSNTNGTLQSATSTCKDWTVSVASTANGRPMCGFSWPRSSTNLSSGAHWMSTFVAPGCAKGFDIYGTGGPRPGDMSVGAGGGYGGIYCFALNP